MLQLSQNIGQGNAPSFARLSNNKSTFESSQSRWTKLFDIKKYAQVEMYDC
jgi:hypothetical protein